jgi:hypothetical protein
MDSLNKIWIFLAILWGACIDTDLRDETKIRTFPDLKPLQVEEISIGNLKPKSRPVRVNVYPIITVKFSKKADPKTISEDTFVLIKEEKKKNILLDINNPPLSETSKKQIVPSSIRMKSSLEFMLIPLELLEEYTRYSVILSKAIRSQTGLPLSGPDGIESEFIYSFETGSMKDSPAVPSLKRPLNNEKEVPINICEIIIEFSKPLPFELKDKVHLYYNQQPIKGKVVSSGNGLIASFQPLQELFPLKKHFILFDLLQEKVSSLVYRQLSFKTSKSADYSPPEISPITCSPCEEKVENLCIDILDKKVNIRWKTDELSISGVMILEKDKIVKEIKNNNLNFEHVFLIEASLKKEYKFRVYSMDIACNVREQGPFSFKLEEDSRPVIISEILFNPRGAEPAQEFIEIQNIGSKPLSLDGWMIDDNGDKNGDIIETTELIFEGGYGVIIGEKYNLNSPVDSGIFESAVILRVKGSLGSSGLRNDGETVELYDPFGRAVSCYLNFFSGSALHSQQGVSIERIEPSGLESSAKNWAFNRNLSSTPGRKNSVTDIQ